MAHSFNGDSRFVRGVAASVFIATSLAFASPALAESTTLVCEAKGDIGVAPETTIFIVDYSASTVTPDWPVHLTMPAVITAQEIRFRYDPPPARIEITWIGTISRVTGEAEWTSYEVVRGEKVYNPVQRHQGRCRVGTQKF
jgi:hypothetical protein